jgi:hypothetical protein
MNFNEYRIRTRRLHRVGNAPDDGGWRLMSQSDDASESPMHALVRWESFDILHIHESG